MPWGFANSIQFTGRPQLCQSDYTRVMCCLYSHNRIKVQGLPLLSAGCADPAPPRTTQGSSGVLLCQELQWQCGWLLLNITPFKSSSHTYSNHSLCICAERGSLQAQVCGAEQQRQAKPTEWPIVASLLSNQHSKGNKCLQEH